MSAFVEHSFKRGFLLDEPKLRRIHELVSVRLAKITGAVPLTYRVYRGDSYSYETQAVDDVANEDNDDWRAISTIELKSHNEAVLEFKLSFAKKDGVSLRIVGDDRDAVFLLFSDLREYIGNEVLGGRRFGRDAIRISGLLLSFAGMAAVFWWSTKDLIDSPDDLARAIASPDLGAKLNYLLEQRSKGPSGFFFGVLAIPMMLGMFSTEIAGAIANALFPTNLFLFGKRKTSFEARRKLLGNVFWVVVVGALVSIATGLIVWWFTKE
jgi:hypothetical protein